MENLKTVVIDADEVLIKFLKAFIAFYNHKYKTAFRFEDFLIYDICKLLRISREQFFIEERAFYESEFYANIEIIDNGYTVIESASQMYGLRVVTGRGMDVSDYLLKTLMQLYAPHHFVSVDHVGSHYNGDFEAHKYEKCIQYNASVMIDDLPSHLICAAEKGIHGILINKLWNKNFNDLPSIIYRADNLEQAFEIINRKQKMLFW